MSRYGSIVLGLGASTTRVVRATDPAILESLVNQQITALGGGFTIVALTLAGAGNGQAFTVTIEAGAAAAVLGGFLAPPTVRCVAGSDPEALRAGLESKITAPGTLADVQVAGSSAGNYFMAMAVFGSLLATGAAGPTETRSNKGMPALTTVNDGDQGCATAVTTTPAASSAAGGYVGARVNGVGATTGDGTTVGVMCYFSGTGGATARAMKDIVAGDTFHWNQSVAGYNLDAATDIIDYMYGVDS
jgi:hypothetical protein